jgi:hypothetical protein
MFALGAQRIKKRALEVLEGHSGTVGFEKNRGVMASVGSVGFLMGKVRRVRSTL